MGLLRDTAYWSNVSNQMFKMRPSAGVPLSREETIIFLDTACKALTDLISDHDLEKDLNLAANILSQNAPSPDLFSSGIRDFLGEFARAEMVLLLQSGMDFDAAVNLVWELQRAAEFAKDINEKTVSTLRERLEPLRDKTCKATSDERHFLAREGSACLSLLESRQGLRCHWYRHHRWRRRVADRSHCDRAVDGHGRRWSFNRLRHRHDHEGRRRTLSRRSLKPCFQERERGRDWWSRFMIPLFDRLDALPPLSGEERQLLESVKALARDEIAPRAADYDRSGAFPWKNVEAINALGLNAMFVPEEYGGAGLSYAAYLACVREISAACASTGIIWATNFHAVKPLIDFGSEEQKQRLLPRVAEGALCALAITEPEAGSDATGMKTRFTPSGNDGVVIDGGKTFITNGDVADLILLFGKWSDIPPGDKNGRGAITALYLEKDTPGFSVLRKEDKLGHRASSTAALAFDNCRVSHANVLGEPGQGLPLLLAALNKSRPSVAAHALGIARAAFGDAIAYINERRQSGRRIVEFQGIQFMLADLATDLAMCEAWLWHVAGLIERGESDIGPEASMLKMRASDLAMRIATEAVQLYGGYGYIKDNRVERLLRDAKITQIWEGTNQLHRQLIGRSFIARK